jgi:MerR family transcriptional regulator, heat shock protein HspR
MIEGMNITDFNQPVYSIGTVARLLGVSVQTLRLYEHEGLIIPFKKDSLHRLYSDSDLNRLRCIRTAITEMKFSIPAIKSMYSMVPCWEIKNCSIDDKSHCRAYTMHSEPCWNYRHSDNSCASENCRECEVYVEYTDCEKIKNGIKNLLGNK